MSGVVPLLVTAVVSLTAGAYFITHATWSGTTSTHHLISTRNRAWAEVLKLHPINVGTMHTECAVYAPKLTPTLTPSIVQQSVQTQAANMAEGGYGEPTPKGLKYLTHTWPRECALDESSVFYDIGSGFGALAIWMRLNTNASAVHGLEINQCRHNGALRLAARVREVVGERALGQLHFTRGDVRKSGFSDATHILMASQCMGDELVSSILSMAKDHAPNLRCIVKLVTPHVARDSQRVVRQVDALGHVTAVRHIKTTYGGASAIFIRRGECMLGSAAGCRNYASALSEAKGMSAKILGWAFERSHVR